MKNLFKNLMLVAVAAMAFTACSQDVNEVNKIERVTRYEFTANIADDTRSGFAEKEEGATAYKSEWFGDETLKVCANGAFASAQTIKVEDTEGHFTVEFNGDNVPSMIDVYSPASAWNDENYPTIPAVQTPGAHSVDPAAHILKAQAASVESGVVTLQHMVAYGKMTVNTPADFEISKVELSLVGLPNSAWADNQTYSYTINANEVEGNVFWFATEAMQIVKEFTVTAYNAENQAYSKTVSGLTEGQLGFTAGRVSTFSVSGLEAYVEPETPKFTSVDTMFYNSNAWGYVDVYDEDYCGVGDVLLIFSSEELGTLQLNFYNTFTSFVIPAAMYDENHVYTGSGTKYSYYQPAGSYTQYQLSDVEVVVTHADNKQYNFVFTVKYNEGASEFTATYTGFVEYFDLRTAIATPNAVATVDGKMITISWDPVTGAEKYVVESNSFATIETTETTVIIEAPEYSTSYTFNIKAVAADTDPDYKSSSSITINVTTGKDPNIWADVVANNIVWDSSNGAFKMTGEVVSGTAWGYSGDYVRLYINESDRPGNNSIKVGTYTGCGSKNPQAGQFGAKFSLYWGTTTYESVFGSTSTVEVSYDETVGYTIVLTHGDKTYGYKGMPEGWVAPSEGGDEPVNPDPTPDPDQSDEIWTVATDGAINGRYTYFRFTKGSDVITGMFVYPTIAQIPGLYEVETLTSYNNYRISEVKLNGIFTDSEEGTVNIEMTPDGGYKFTLNLTLNGTKYAGTAMM